MTAASCAFDFSGDIGSPGHEGPSPAAALSADRLTVRYKGASKPALNDFSLNIARGEIFGLLGPNGAGKTTAISVMTALLPPDAGRVLIHDGDAARRPGRARDLFGVVPQETALYADLSIRENLRYYGRLYGISGKTLTRRVAECLAFTGLEEHAGQRFKTCSGGMKRRANLAAGLLHAPRLLFLDEPTAGVDVQSRRMILEKLQNLNREGTTMIYTTHYIEEAETFCTRIGVIDEGRIIALGAPDALIRESRGCKDLGDLFLSLTGKDIRD